MVPLGSYWNCTGKPKVKLLLGVLKLNLGMLNVSYRESDLQQ